MYPQVGDGVIARVARVDPKKKKLDFSLLPFTLLDSSRLVSAADVTAAAAGGEGAVTAVLPAGSLVMGRLSRVQVGLGFGTCECACKVASAAPLPCFLLCA